MLILVVREEVVLTSDLATVKPAEGAAEAGRGNGTTGSEILTRE